MSQAAPNLRVKEEHLAHRNQRIQWAGLGFLLLVLSLTAWGSWAVFAWMKDPHRLPLAFLIVTGERRYTTDDDIRQAIMSLGAPGTFMTQDVNIVQQQIERLPWVQQASVRKQWPDQLTIHVVEYVPIARWNDVQVINSEGEPFTLPARKEQSTVLPLLYGPEGSGKEVLEGYQTMLAVLAAGNFKLKSVIMSARHSWQLTLNNDVRLELGRSDMTKRLQRFMQFYPFLEQQAQSTQQKVNYLDLRYDSGVAVGWFPALVVAESE